MNIEEKVYEIIEKLCGSTVGENSLRLREDLGFDSLNMVLLLIEIETEFSIKLNESDMNPYALRTVDDVILLVRGYGQSDNSMATTTTEPI